MIHSNVVVSELFNNRDISELNPILFNGPCGVGKEFYIQEYLYHSFCVNNKSFYERKDCDCISCKRIKSDKTSDIIKFSGEEKTEEVREKISSVDGNPQELGHKVLILRNIHKYNKNILDSLLKIIEEPQKLKIFSTSTNLEFVPEAIKSRFFIFQFPYLDQDILSKILEDQNLESYKFIFDRYKFRSVFQLDVFKYFDFEEKFDSLFTRVSSSFEIKEQIKIFLNGIKDSRHHVEDVLDFFLEYYNWRVFNLYDENSLFGINYNLILKSHSYTLFKYMNRNNSYYFMNLENQLFNFFNSVYCLRKLC